jgi:hypothetical protein
MMTFVVYHVPSDPIQAVLVARSCGNPAFQVSYGE